MKKKPDPRPHLRLVHSAHLRLVHSAPPSARPDSDPPPPGPATGRTLPPPAPAPEACALLAEEKEAA
jgi:hypothetical protein